MLCLILLGYMTFGYSIYNLKFLILLPFGVANIKKWLVKQKRLSFILLS